MSDGSSRGYPPELRERAVRTVAEISNQHDSEWAAISEVARLLRVGCAETVRKWVRQAQVDAGSRPGTTTEVSDDLKRLRRENAESRRANAILKTASAFFAAELCAARPGVSGGGETGPDLLTSPSSSTPAAANSGLASRRYDGDLPGPRLHRTGHLDPTARRRIRPERCCPPPDRGSQYTSIRFTERLAEAGIQPSAGAVGSSYDNAPAETINGLGDASARSLGYRDVISRGNGFNRLPDPAAAANHW
jgi:transposase